MKHDYALDLFCTAFCALVLFSFAALPVTAQQLPPTGIGFGLDIEADEGERSRPPLEVAPPLQLAPVAPAAQPDRATVRRTETPSGWGLDISFDEVPGYSAPAVAAGDAAGNTYVVSQETRATSGLDMVTRKYDASGALLWAATFSDEGGSSERPTAALATEDAVYITVEARNGEGRPVGVTVKYDGSGGLSWARYFVDPVDTPDQNTHLRAMALSPEGAVVVGGTTDEEDGGYGSDMLLLKYSPEGDEVWRTTYGTGTGPSITDDGIRGLDTDSAGNVYVVGAGEDESFYTAKFSPDGDFVWGRLHPRVETRGVFSGSLIAVAEDGAIFASGFYRGTQGNVVTTLRYTPDGDLVWEHTLSGADNEEDIEVGPDGQPVVLATREGGGMMLEKVTPEGETDWAYEYLGPDGVPQPGWAYDLEIAEDGTSYATGFTWDEVSPVRLAVVGVAAGGAERWERTFLGETHGLAVGLGVVASPAGVRVAGTVVEAWYETLLLSYDASGAQQWAAFAEGADTSLDRAADAVTGAGGGLFVTGRTWTPEGGYDLLTLGLDYNGDVAWVDKYDVTGGTDVGSVVAPLGDGVVVGAVASTQSEEIVTVAVAYSPDGDREWTFTGQHGTPVDVAEDGEGGAYVLCSRTSPSNVREYALLRLSASGELLWAASESGVSETHHTAPVGVAAVPTGAVVLSADSAAPYDPDYLTVWYGPEGDELVRRRYSGSTHPTLPRDVPRRLLADSTGAVYAVGHSKGYSEGSETDVVVAHYDAAGDEVWIGRFVVDEEDQYAYDAVLDPNGGLMVSGTSRRIEDDVATFSIAEDGSLRWFYVPEWSDDRSSGHAASVEADASGRALVVGPHAREERWDVVVQTFSDGEEVWYERFIGRGDMSPWGFLAALRVSTATDPEDNLYIAHDVEGYAAFEDVNAFSAIAIRRIDHGTVTSSEGSPSGVSPRAFLHQPYPNPAQTRVQLHYEVAGSGAVRLSVYDVLGREVAVVVNGRTDAGRHRATFDVRSLAAGVYVFRLVSGTASASSRVVVLPD